MSQQMTKYQYGGHATFPVRYGWLPKGLHLLARDGGFSTGTDMADNLGLGSKMVESLAFWLVATGLASGFQHDARGGGRQMTNLSRVVHDNDPYCELPGTWWFLHLSLIRREGTVWSWFFNDYSERLFDRIGCADAFLTHTKGAAQRSASPSVATKDIACLINAYAARPGVDVVDPDDVGACPFRELGLIIRHDSVSRFERARNPIGVPPEVFLACTSLLSGDIEKTALSLRELATLRKGPGKALGGGLEFIEEMVGRIGSNHMHRDVSVHTSAGDRFIEVPAHKIDQWAKLYYERVGVSMR